MTQPPFCLPIASPWHKVHHLMPRGRGSSASIRRLLAPIPYSALRRRCSRGRGSRRLKTRTKSTNHADLVLLATISWSGELLLYSPRLGWMEGVKLSSQGASSLCLRGALVAQLLYLFLAWRRHLVPNEDLKGAAQTAQLLDRSFLLPPPRTVPYLYCSLLAPSSLSLSLPPSLFLFLPLSFSSSLSLSLPPSLLHIFQLQFQLSFLLSCVLRRCCCCLQRSRLFPSRPSCSLPRTSIDQTTWQPPMSKRLGIQTPPWPPNQ
jgi:hypothetical protein